VFEYLDRSLFWKTYFRLMYYYGCRVSEPAILFREDVSLEREQVLIRRLKKPQFRHRIEEVDGRRKRVRDESKKLGDGFVEHVYGMPPGLVGLLKQHMQTLKGANPWLFPSPKKPRKASAALERMSLIRRSEGFSAIGRHKAERVFVEAAEAAGVPENLRHSHTLRHTRATLLLADGAKEEDVKDLLGHSSIAVTRGYLGVAKSMRLRRQTTAYLGLGDGW
jgi:integrase